MGEQWERTVKAIAILGGAWVAWTLGNVPWPVLGLCGLMAIDFLTGVGAAYIKGAWSSDIGFRGVVKKMMGLFLVGALGIVQVVAASVWEGTHIPTMAVAAGMLCGVELISILENVVNAGYPVPAALRKALIRIKPVIEGEEVEDGH